MIQPQRLSLPQVTLCAVTSVNVAATVRALEASVAQVDFAEVLLFTDAVVCPLHPSIRVLPIAPLRSSAAYSDFLLTRLASHVVSTHCMIAQWDGHLLRADRWNPAFLDYDYIGASWPQFDDGHDVGNGGFSIRSRQLMELCRDPQFIPVHPEDVAIGRTNRAWLEAQGMRFAPRDLADAFATERTGDLATSFGYHGAFNMPRALGPRAFWQVYGELDELGSIRHDFGLILRHTMRGSGGMRRARRMIADRLRHALGR
ncbi:DUF5672 family protein [Novosphingobium sp. Leaf2]|uniref:DUF5672 family protein n=1 Tax=Novosphingobium sp. Leaf2 TaxID=1735670 RepID=UPI0006FCACF2|nr:DUF5672 family protein [Novosphingobium sp. Leaf2]KQM18294.1 hypothetical protein ASE49_08705 [Novosphingobium sp. Leaf2]